MKNDVFKKSQLISYTQKKNVHKVVNKRNLYCEFGFTVFCFLSKIYLK